MCGSMVWCKLYEPTVLKHRSRCWLLSLHTPFKFDMKYWKEFITKWSNKKRSTSQISDRKGFLSFCQLWLLVKDRSGRDWEALVYLSFTWVGSKSCLRKHLSSTLSVAQKLWNFLDYVRNCKHSYNSLQIYQVE